MSEAGEGGAALASAPRATYRLQFHQGFTFRHALAIVDYLADLGISHVYASPILAARPGSLHGYDIIDHNRLNPELGTTADFDALVAALHERGIGIILDIVPNHMGVGGKDNTWWLDVLEWGEDSPYAPFFDIDFNTNRRGLRGKVLIPVLGDQYGKVLGEGEMTLRFDPDEGSFSAWYHDHRFPIDPRDYARILDAPDAAADARLRPLVARLALLKDLKPIGEAYAGAKELKRRLAEAAGDRATAQAIARAVDRLNGTPGDLESWMALHRLIEGQSYRPAYWRVAADEINYRRFFNINDLAGIRVELRELFEESHRMVFRLLEDGKVQGLRIDHIDGLFDPREYCERVQARAGRPGQPAYVVVEKILAAYERLPEEWPIAGTSGYDVLNLINGIFVDPAGERRLDRFYRRYTGRGESFDELLYASKKRIMQVNLASEMTVLANELHRLSSAYLPTRDFTLRGIRDAIEEVLAYFPVYRTYVTAAEGASAQDRRYIEWATARARKASPAADTSVFDFLRGALTGDLAANAGYRPEAVFRVAMRAQQISGPVMAKGMEDTAFYRYARLISLNEVGGDPRRFGVSLAAFHHTNQARREKWPLEMLAGSTHDTKRGEDGRARINLLSEMPNEWARRVLLWSRLNRSRRTESESEGPMPHPHDEYLFYQSLVGAWPIAEAAALAAEMGALPERVDEYMRKAVREGKERSSWGNPNQPYEEALSRFVRGALEVSPTNPFPGEFADFIARIARWGTINGLAQTLLKLTLPGVPDTYQGSELWDFSLVDPDNRRPVDFVLRRRLLEAGPAAAPDWRDGGEKLRLICAVLQFRRREPALFTNGVYDAVTAEGDRADHVCAFVRSHADRRIVAIVPRLVARLADGGSGGAAWHGTVLRPPDGDYRELFTGRRFQCADTAIPLARLLDDFPVALLIAE